MKNKYIIWLMFTLFFLITCNEEKINKFQFEDIEWIGPLNPEGIFDIEDISSNESGIIFYSSFNINDTNSIELYCSNDNGLNWEKMYNQFNFESPQKIIGGKDSMVFLPTYDGIYYSTNSGEDWILFNNSTGGDGTNIIITNTGILCALIFGNTFKSEKVLLSSDNGFTWREMKCPDQKSFIFALNIDKNGLMYLINSKGELWLTGIENENWRMLTKDLDLIQEPLFNSVHRVNNYILIYRVYSKPLERIDTTGNYYFTNHLYATIVHDLTETNTGKIFLATDDGLNVSQDSGENWEKIPCEINNIEAVHLTKDGYLFIAGERKIYRSKNKVE